MGSDPPETFQHAVSEAIRAHAMGFPDTVEGASCVNRAFAAGGKNFVFLGENDDVCTLRLKVDDSRDDLAAREAREPERYSVGTGGWTKLSFPADEPPPLEDLERWITESFRLLAPKRVQAQADV